MQKQVAGALPFPLLQLVAGEEVTEPNASVRFEVPHPCVNARGHYFDGVEHGERLQHNASLLVIVGGECNRRCHRAIPNTAHSDFVRSHWNVGNAKFALRIAARRQCQCGNSHLSISQHAL